MSVLVRAAVVLCLVGAMLAVVVSRASAASQPFAARFSTDDNGSIALFGNLLMTCPTAASGCATSQTAVPPAGANNNNFTMTYIDVDGDPSTFDSSSAQVTFPAGGTVLFAGLYWGARTQGSSFQGDATRMLLRGPGGAYQPVTTQATFGPGTFGSYQQFANVTTTVQAGGAGIWWGANVAAATGYVPGSIQVALGPNVFLNTTDPPGDDQAEFDAASRTITVRLGTGASASVGGTIDAGASTSFRFRVTVDQAAAGTTITNRSSLAYTARTLARRFSYTTNPAEVPVQENADLALTKTTAPDPAVAGQIVSSTLQVTNNGPNPAQNVTLTDSLPDGVTFVGSSPGQVSCSESAGVVTCAIGDVANGATVTVSIVGRVAPGTTAAALTNIATVGSDTPDPNLTDNTAGATVELQAQADLAISKTAAPATVVPGQQVTFTLTATNQGPSTARLVAVNDTVDAGEFTIISANSPVASCTTTQTTVVCTFGSLAPGAGRTVTVVAQLSPGFTGSSAANTATVESNGGTPDPDTANNTATITVPVGPRRLTWR